MDPDVWAAGLRNDEPMDEQIAAHEAKAKAYNQLVII